MKSFQLLLFSMLLASLVLAGAWMAPENGNPPGTTFLEPHPQRSGNPDSGYYYLVYGDYISSGIPLGLFRQRPGAAADSLRDLERTGMNDGIPYNFTAVRAANRVTVAAPNCLTCHAEYLLGNLVVGLGNNSTDYSLEQGAAIGGASRAVRMMYGPNSPQWKAFFPAARSGEITAPAIKTAVRGVNPADKLFAALSAHRQGADLMWLDSAQFLLPTELVATDVPPLWNIDKKNALYYNGLGRGDFARLSSAAGMLTLADSAEARRIDQHMTDVMAWLRTIQPPAYPYPVDTKLAAQGKVLFEASCAKCHGIYELGKETYPNLLVDLSKIKTDSLLASSYTRFPWYHNWYNSSWYAQGPNGGKLLPTHGYVAPPLDGIWATAPYLHNGSVPTLADLLESTKRPTFWRRKFDNQDYDTEKLGWRYTAESSKNNAETYDTTVPGYGNGGHYFGDRLSAEERKAVLEYLKTL